MRLALKLHPDSPRAAAAGIDVEVMRPRPGELALLYVVTGKIGDLRIPPVVAPARADELWRTTCFEAFVRSPSTSAYYEFNFSPSMQWAAYRFSGYRSGMCVASEVSAPSIDVRRNDNRLELSAAVIFPGDGAWRLGLSAIIEDLSGVKSYWALAHPPGKPDFHHSDCFGYELPAAEQS